MKKSTTKNLPFQEEKVVVPSQSTLDFLKLYARTCYVDKKLPKDLNCLCVN